MSKAPMLRKKSIPRKREMWSSHFMINPICAGSSYA